MKAELYILGVLHRGDFHPYEIKRRLTQAMIECFTDVDVGTLYYAVRQLADTGLLTAVAHQRVARGGMRTVYRITPRGRARFRELLHAQFAAEGDLRQTLYGPMLFLHLADLKLVAEALRSQIERQKARLAEIRKLRKQWGSDAAHRQPPLDAAHGGAMPPRSALAPRCTCRCGGRAHSRYSCTRIRSQPRPDWIHGRVQSAARVVSFSCGDGIIGALNARHGGSMGSELQCTVRTGGKTSKGKALLETSEIIFRGDFRLQDSLCVHYSPRRKGRRAPLELDRRQRDL